MKSLVLHDSVQYVLISRGDTFKWHKTLFVKSVTDTECLFATDLSTFSPKISPPYSFKCMVKAYPFPFALFEY